MKNRILMAILPALACFGLSSAVQAVIPGPDGCYPNFTTAEGCDALKSLTTGVGNTALGWRSLFSDSTGSYSTAVGVGALALKIGQYRSDGQPPDAHIVSGSGLAFKDMESDLARL